MPEIVTVGVDDALPVESNVHTPTPDPVGAASAAPPVLDRGMSAGGLTETPPCVARTVADERLAFVVAAYDTTE
jgi:hypothetical protein